MGLTALTIQDLIPYGAIKTSRKVDKDAILPYLILPGLFLVATISRPVTIVVMVVIGMGALYVHSRPRQKNRSAFFYSWTMSSAICMIVVFESGVLGFFEITQLENFVFLILLSCTCYFFYKMKAVADFELATGSSKGKEYRSAFFYSWTMSSTICMIVVFESRVLSFSEITQLEILVFLILLACTCYFFYKMKAVADFELATGSSKRKEYSPVLTSDSHYCQICQIEVNERFFHSIWWDCCVLRPNYIYFLAGQIFAFATLLFGTNLGLTTVCQPFIFYDVFLMPQDCDEVYSDFNSTVCFVACVYGLGYLFVVALVLIRQLLVYIPKYSEPQWKKLVNVLNV